MQKDNNRPQDEGLRGNEKIEDAIAALQQEPTGELLAHALTMVRLRMQEGGQVIVAVEPNLGETNLNIQAIRTDDGHTWWAAFTSFEEELKGSDSVKSTFLADLDKLFDTALEVPEIEGIILNPWNRTLMLNKRLIRIVRNYPKA